MREEGGRTRGKEERGIKREGGRDRDMERQRSEGGREGKGRRERVKGIETRKQEGMEGSIHVVINIVASIYTYQDQALDSGTPIFNVLWLSFKQTGNHLCQQWFV